ncbi:hypothetical protein TIFTF001_016538 [Ficus carica]|uniref:Uncharacterized protein n=1 Tax=Ficus carica TaxID=3494 RepID=A0AA88AJQ8_FICCA|nr:hypothetical protein TIFTF001_016538 [Ficus carica]
MEKPETQNQTPDVAIVPPSRPPGARLPSPAAARELVALVVDLFGHDAFDVAREFNLSSSVFYPTTATALSLLLHLPSLEETTPCE